MRLNKFVLITLVSILVIVKWVGIPLIEWQNKKVLDINSFSNRLLKAEYLVSQQADFLNYSVQSQAILTGDAVHHFELNPQTRLTIQRTLESVFSTSNTSIKRFSWVLQETKSPAQFVAQISFNASFDNLLAIYQALDAHQPRFYIKEAKIRRLPNRSSGVQEALSGEMMISAIAVEKLPESTNESEVVDE